MAKLIMTSTEPLKIMNLIEQMFPGINLDTMESMLTGVTLSGALTLNKKIDATTSVTLEVTINPG